MDKELIHSKEWTLPTIAHAFPGVLPVESYQEVRFVLMECERSEVLVSRFNCVPSASVRENYARLPMGHGESLLLHRLAFLFCGKTQIRGGPKISDQFTGWCTRYDI
jgi:hypothetical protein